MHSKSDNIEFVINGNAEVMEELSESFLNRY